MPKPRIIVLSAKGADTFTREQRERLLAAGETRFVEAPERLSRERFLESLGGAQVAGLSPRGTPPLDDELLSALPELRAVALPTTGTEWIQLAALERRGIRVVNLPGFSTDSTAEFTWGLILASARNILEASHSVRTGSRSNLLGFELKGKTLGVIGCGAVGKRVAEIGQAFGMRILCFDKFPGADLDALLVESDVVSVHLPLNEETLGLLTTRRLGRMKKTAILVNTARPALLPLSLVVGLLEEGRLARYAFDMGYFTRDEILPYADHPKILAVPHVSWFTREAMEREMEGWVCRLIALAEPS